MEGQQKISEILFSCSKSFRKYNKKVEIMIVNHTEFRCVELIVHGVRLGNKATRLYLNAEVLMAKIDANLFSVTFEIKYEAAKRQNRSFRVELELKRTAWNMIVASLIERLQIVPSVFKGEFDIYFEPTKQDLTTMAPDSQRHLNARSDFEFNKKPINLKPYFYVKACDDQNRYFNPFF
jgi:hypothetical protein